MRNIAVRTALFLILIALFAKMGVSTELILQDGRHLEGKLGTLHAIGEDPTLGADAVADIQSIVFLDDDLRRTYVPRFKISNVNQDDPLDITEKFFVPQRSKGKVPVVANVGAIARKQPFDQFGRRTVTMNTARGPVDIIQGITEITPDYTKVEGITHQWDMRIATSSIPTSVLDAVLKRLVKPGDVNGTIKIARFYIQAQLYDDAVRTMQAALAQPDAAPELKQQLDAVFRSVQQMASRQLLDELNVREEAGQYQLVAALLDKFPTEGVSSEILQQVRRKIQEFADNQQQIQNILDNLKVNYNQLPNGELKARISPALRDIVVNINRNTVDRFSSFEQTLDDKALKPDERISLALSGWLLGANDATTNIAVSLSAYNVRALIEQYMACKDGVARAAIFKRFKSEEAAAIKTVSLILAHMTPPEPIEENSHITGDYFRMNCKNIFDGSTMEYYVQLPPEYDPYRKYPAIISLHGELSTPQMQIDWWAGAINEKGKRNGHAGRNGYIIISPAWTLETARQYDYSGSSHGAVLGCLHDANRHFSIDTDRVFISGYSMGATAAWDIAAAHPDLWAGVLAVGPMVDKFLVFCGHNARYVPNYFVFGQYDGNLLVLNSSAMLNKYFSRSYDTTIVEYLGRGHEDFQDEILRMFDWMKRKKRDFNPEKFECKFMRSFDNFFWNLELYELPAQMVADPVIWPPAKGTIASTVTFTIRKKAGISIKTAAARAVVWLNPHIVDFDKKISILINGRKIDTGGDFIEPSLETLLEDVRTRGDRQNPFWVKIEARIRR